MLSRSFSVRTQQYENPPGFVVKDFSMNAFLCPFLDCLNHSTKFNAFYDYCDERNEFQLTSRGKINQGQEICITYGRQKGDHILLSVSEKNLIKKS